MFKCKDCGTEINEGEYKTFGVCDNCWDKASLQNLPKADAYSLLSEVRAVLEDIVEGEYRLFHSDSMDQDTGLEEDIRNLYKKVSEHFI